MNTSHFLGAFSQNICYASSIGAEFCACMYAIERASEMLFVDIWIETDSLIVFYWSCSRLSSELHDFM